MACRRLVSRPSRCLIHGLAIDVKEAKRSWLKQLGVVLATFLLLGFIAALAVFWNAPKVWSGAVLSALAASFSGALAWALICGREARPKWWRTILAGIASGVILHPVFLFLSMLYEGGRLGWSDFLAGSSFFLLIGGIITVPAGVGAAIACKLLGECWGRAGADLGNEFEQ